MAMKLVRTLVVGTFLPAAAASNAAALAVTEKIENHDADYVFGVKETIYSNKGGHNDLGQVAAEPRCLARQKEVEKGISILFAVKPNANPSGGAFNLNEGQLGAIGQIPGSRPIVREKGFLFGSTPLPTTFAKPKPFLSGGTAKDAEKVGSWLLDPRPVNPANLQEEQTEIAGHRLIPNIAMSYDMQGNQVIAPAGATGFDANWNPKFPAQLISPVPTRASPRAPAPATKSGDPSGVGDTVTPSQQPMVQQGRFPGDWANPLSGTAQQVRGDSAATDRHSNSPPANLDHQHGDSKRKVSIVLVSAMKSFFAAVVALYLINPVKSAAASDITISPPDKGGRIFVDVRGWISYGDEKTFAEKTKNLDAENVYVSLSSPGGNVISGGTIGDLIRYRGMNTYVGRDTTCTSVCGLMWLAGRNKFAENSSHIGFHGAFNANTLQPSNEINILLAVYLAQLGYGYEDVLWMLLPPPGNVHWLTSESTVKHHVIWDVLSPPRELDGLWNSTRSPAPAPTSPAIAR
jgi:hypothetical protein